MSLYIASLKNFNKRSFDLIICKKDELDLFKQNQNDVISDLRQKINKKYRKHTLILKDISSLSSILIFIKQHRFSSVAIFIDDLTKDLLNIISKFIEESELSIGLFTKNESLIEENKYLLEEYCVFVSGNKKKTIHPEREFFDVKFAMAVNDLYNDIYEGSVCGAIELPKAGNDKYKIDESFLDKLFKYLNKSKKTNVEVYKKGGISKQVFSKIISGKIEKPTQETIYCLIIGMELNIDDALDLLNSCGFTFSKSSRRDQIVKTFIENEEYDLDEIKY